MGYLFSYLVEKEATVKEDTKSATSRVRDAVDSAVDIASIPFDQANSLIKNWILNSFGIPHREYDVATNSAEQWIIDNTPKVIDPVRHPLYLIQDYGKDRAEEIISELNKAWSGGGGSIDEMVDDVWDLLQPPLAIIEEVKQTGLDAIAMLPTIIKEIYNLFNSFINVDEEAYVKGFIANIKLQKRLRAELDKLEL